MQNKEITKVISRYLNTGKFYGHIEDRYIYRVEEQLQLNFPETYKQFLRQYGSGGVLGIVINGIESNCCYNSSVISSTERYRKLGLDTKCVVIQDCGEFAICLDTSEIIDNECCVISWNRINKKKNKRYKNFNDFLTDVLNEAIDNWDEDE